jgi:hypothetical protein
MGAGLSEDDEGSKKKYPHRVGEISAFNKNPRVAGIFKCIKQVNC